MSPQDVLIYSANIGNYDSFYQPSFDEDFKYTYITDRLIESAIWDPYRVEAHGDPKRLAQYYKLNAHMVSPHHVSLWIDGHMAPKGALQPLISLFLASGADIAMCPHRIRTCTYAEAEACIKARRDDPKVITRHMERYLNEGFPYDFGMGETGILLRRNTPAVREFNQFWYHQCFSGSRRDQLSLMYSAWKLKLEIAWLPYRVNTIPFFKKKKHL